MCEVATDSLFGRCSEIGIRLTPVGIPMTSGSWGKYYTDSYASAGFISSTWKIKSTATFAGPCVGVICPVVSLELLRRLQRAYERYLMRQAKVLRISAERFEDVPSSSGSGSPRSNTLNKDFSDVNARAAPLTGTVTNTASTPQHHSRLSVPQQAIGALMHVIQFAVVYFIMLLAM